MVVEIPSSALPHSAVLLGRGEEAGGSTERRYSDGGVFHKSFPQFLRVLGELLGGSLEVVVKSMDVHGRLYTCQTHSPTLFSDVLGMFQYFVVFAVS